MGLLLAHRAMNPRDVVAPPAEGEGAEALAPPASA